MAKPEPGAYNSSSMSILKVARMGHPVLRERARPLDKSTLRNPLLQKLIDDMIETMHEYHGVGLAAPQVHEGVRLFVALLDEDPGLRRARRPRSINPEIVPNAATPRRGWEGCLSIPDIRGMVPAVHRHHGQGARSRRQADRAAPEGFRRARRAARNRSSRRRAVLRSDDVDAVADVSRRVLALSRKDEDDEIVIDDLIVDDLIGDSIEDCRRPVIRLTSGIVRTPVITIASPINNESQSQIKITNAL